MEDDVGAMPAARARGPSAGPGRRGRRRRGSATPLIGARGPPPRPPRAARCATSAPSASGVVARQLVAQPGAAVGAADERAQRSRPCRRHGVRADRRVAVGLERADERALGGQRGGGRVVVRSPRPARAPPRRLRAPSRAACPGPRRAPSRRSSTAVARSSRPEPLQPRAGQDDRVEAAVGPAAAGACRRCRAARRRRGPAAARAAERRRGAGCSSRPARRAGRASSDAAPHSASRGSARARRRGDLEPSASCAGTSLAECTATSTSPREQRRVDLLDPALLVRPGPARSPVVVIGHELGAAERVGHLRRPARAPARCRACRSSHRGAAAGARCRRGVVPSAGAAPSSPKSSRRTCWRPWLAPSSPAP